MKLNIFSLITLVGSLLILAGFVWLFSSGADIVAGIFMVFLTLAAIPFIVNGIVGSKALQLLRLKKSQTFAKWTILMCSIVYLLLLIVISMTFFKLGRGLDSTLVWNIVRVIYIFIFLYPIIWLSLVVNKLSKARK